MRVRTWRPSLASFPSSDQPRALCVAVHDVAPATWPQCLHLLQAIRAVADIPISWLVVPRFHGVANWPPACEALLERRLLQGDELVLHGLTHCDAAPGSRNWRDQWLRRRYTQGEGEFSAIDAGEARRRIDAGLAWFAQRGWPVSGFVPPAWLISEPARVVLAEYPFTYTTNFARFQLLRPEHGLFSPALVYAARNRAGRAVSPPAARLLLALLRQAPLVRLALHPRDAHYPALVRHAQGLIEQMLLSREALTKAAFANRLTSTAPTSRQGSSGGGQSLRNSLDGHSAGLPPSGSAA